MKKPLDAHQLIKNTIEQVAMHLPQILFLFPTPSGSPDDPSSWRAIPIYLKSISEDPERCLQVNLIDDRLSDIKNLHQLIDMIALDLKDTTGKITVFTLEELMEGITEATIEQLNTIMIQDICMSHITEERLLRYIGEIITGKGPHLQTEFFKDAHMAWTGLRKTLRKIAGQFDWPKVLNNFKRQPVILINTREPLCFAIKLPPKVFKHTSFPWLNMVREKSGHKSDGFTRISNPLFDNISSIGKIVQSRTINGVSENPAKDMAFMENLLKQRRLSGKGGYSNFSLESISQDSQNLIRIKYNLGDKPFLQQVSHDPIYVFWDLKRYPIHVYVYVNYEEKTQIPLSLLNEVGFTVFCSHPSISKHAFCKSIDESGQTVSICMEKTRERIVESYRQESTYDPIVCFLDQMRGAGRVLRYGVCEKNQNIQQYNPFNKVPEKEFQAIIRGHGQVKAFARSKGAEIIPYNR